MANGASVVLKLIETSEPPSAPAVPPDASPPAPEEIAIGLATAAAAYEIAIAVDSCLRTGGLAESIKDAGAVRLAAIAQLALDHADGDDDFFHKARVEGRRALRRYFDEDINPHLIDRAIDNAIDPVIEIVGRVVKSERVFRQAWAN